MKVMSFGQLHDQSSTLSDADDVEKTAAVHVSASNRSIPKSSSLEDVKLLETLHSIGRQLMLPRLVYERYAQLISRLLDRHHMASTGPQVYTYDSPRINFQPRNNHTATGRFLPGHSQGVSYGRLDPRSTATMQRVRVQQ